MQLTRGQNAAELITASVNRCRDKQMPTAQFIFHLPDLTANAIDYSTSIKIRGYRNSGKTALSAAHAQVQ